MHRVTFALIFFTASINGQLSLSNDLKSKLSLSTSSPLGNPLNTLNVVDNTGVSCSCAVFMSGQFKKGSSEPPKGHPALIQETDINFPCTPAGNKLCTNKCLETIVKHLPNSPAIVCGTIDRDCHRERAYLFVQNCDANQWTNTNLSAGREFCCKSGEPVSCLSSLL